MRLSFTRSSAVNAKFTNNQLLDLLSNFSIEVMPRTVDKIDDFKSLIPKETPVYIAHLEGTPIEAMINTANRLRKMNFNVIPHFPARLIENKTILEDWLKKYADVGIEKCLVLAGSPLKPIGSFQSSMELLATGLFDKYNFTEFFCAGHPEGNKDIDIGGTDQNLMEALKWKNDFFQRTQIKWSLTTQFCFEIEPIKAWEARLSNEGIEIPINIGVAGPAKLQTMIKFALVCGVGPSIRVLEKRAKDLTKLLLPYSPDRFLHELSDYKTQNPNSKIQSVHFFPLGGIKQTTEFLSKINTLKTQH